jgi:hypothetical protein
MVRTSDATPLQRRSPRLLALPGRISSLDAQQVALPKERASSASPRVQRAGFTERAFTERAFTEHASSASPRVHRGSPRTPRAVPPVWRAANRAAASAVLSRASALYRASPGHAAAVAAAAAAMRRRGHGRGETAEAPLERPIFRIAPVASTVSDGRCGPSVASSVGASVVAWGTMRLPAPTDASTPTAPLSA